MKLTAFIFKQSGAYILLKKRIVLFLKPNARRIAMS